MKMPNQKELKRLFSYDPDSGELTWNHRPELSPQWNGRHAGKSAGSKPDRDGYIRIKVLGRMLQAHRVIWAMHTGQRDFDQLDHIDGNPENNRISNLRLASPLENMRNLRIPRTNTSGVIGVHWSKRQRKWEAFIGVQGTRISLGVFHDKADAADARKAAEISYGFHPNHGRTENAKDRA